MADPDFFTSLQLTSNGEAALLAEDARRRNRCRDVQHAAIWPASMTDIKKSSSLLRFARERSAMIESPFLLLPEVDKISRLSDLTRWRLEKSGRFPKRIRIAGRKVAWRKSEIEAWVADPEGWARRHNTQPRILG
jgi:prophage regulatory protein